MSNMTPWIPPMTSKQTKLKGERKVYIIAEGWGRKQNQRTTAENKSKSGATSPWKQNVITHSSRFLEVQTESQPSNEEETNPS